MSYRFANPEVFQWLWLVPLLIFAGWYLMRRQRRQIDKALGARLAPFLLSTFSEKRRRWKRVLEVVVIVLLCLALARPQAGQSQQKVKSEGIEVMLLVDVSQSMMAEDARPSRLDLAKKELQRFLQKIGGHKVGLIAFAGSAILLSPLTNDKSALNMYIESLSSEAVSSQGTEFRKALAEAKNAFDRGGVEETQESVVTRAIVIASDGEDNEPGAMAAAEELVDSGIRIFALGFGTEKGGPIPIRDERGNLRGYLKNQEGQTVVSQTKGTVLKDLARQGQGSFHHVTFGGNSISQLISDLDRLEKSEFASAEMTNYDEKYQIFLIIALLLAFAEILISERKSVGRLWKGRFEVSEN